MLVILFLINVFSRLVLSLEEDSPVVVYERALGGGDPGVAAPVGPVPVHPAQQGMTVLTTMAGGRLVTLTIPDAVGQSPPTTTQAVNAATTPGVPATATTPGLPATATTPGVPATATTPGIPATATTPGVPVAATTPGVPVAATTPGVPATATTPDVPATATGTATTPGVPTVTTPTGTLSTKSTSSTSTTGKLTTTAPVGATPAAALPVSNPPVANPLGRPDPTTAQTPLPLVPVTTLDIQSYATITNSATTYTTSIPMTSFWVTVVVNGRTIALQTTYVQRFKSFYSTVALPSSGAIGLGSISGTVGIVKPALQVSSTNGGAVSYATVSPVLAAVLLFLL